MDVKIYHLIEGAKQAKGLTVIIDVFRAFSLECYLYDMGAENILPVGSLDEARRLKAEHPDYVLIGERGGRKCEGFDFGNSPSTVEPDKVKGKTVVHTTSAGTQGVANAVGAEELITGSLVNAKAVAEYIRSRKPEEVSLVAMGKSGKTPTEEDELCARYIRSLLLEEEFPIREELIALKDHGGQQFFDPDNQDVYPEPDYWLCARNDIFPFVIQVERDHEILKTRKISVFTE
ncbi:MAG: 2-phosphosulfolactate phosphatase [Clostridiales bacterium]|nr:2-phosphosulfolactate phosphatase [Clostridiales bacterium]